LRIYTVALLALLVGVLVLPAELFPGSRQFPPIRPAPVVVDVRVDASRPRPPVPRRFLGLSFEVASAGQLSRFANTGDFETLLRSLGPGVLRLGGVSADTQAAWADAQTHKPNWASGELNPADLRRLAKLAGGAGWRVLLTLGLAHYNPQLAAHEVASAKSALGGALLGIELGNEPDSYSVHGLRPGWWSAAHYNAEAANYLRAVSALTPGVAVAGPDVSGSSAFQRWGPSVIDAQRPALLTGHHYPLGCHGAVAPTIANLLSVNTRVLEEQSLTRYLSLARANRIPFRMDETNSVSCGGKAGVSDTFASALWATNYIAHTMARGAAGINLEGNPNRCTGYSPVCSESPQRLARGELHAQPVWYALLLTHSLIGDRPIRTQFATPTFRNVTVNAFRTSGGGLRLVVVDEDPPRFGDLTLRLHVGGGYERASVLALQAPAPSAVSGITLGGRAVAENGAWTHPQALPQSGAAGGVVSVDVAPSSAALISIPTARQSARVSSTH
jgi:hypothetical protein